MRKSLVILFIFVSQMTIFVISQAQSSSGLTELASQFNSFAENHLREKIFLHSDKTVYLTGETCWFSLYCLNASDHRPLEASRIAYVELMNRSGQPVFQSKTGLDSGFGSGSISLSPTLPTGHYLLRAYTAWMQNSGGNFFYSQDITVINTLHGSAADSAAVIERPVAAFFPEGGRLVQQIPSRVACRLRDSRGVPVKAKIEIRNRHRDLLDSLRTDDNGIGLFTVTPGSGDSLYAVVAGDSLHPFMLPSADVTGYTLTVNRDQGHRLLVTVHASASEENKTIFLATHTRQILKNLQTGRISGSMASFQISTDSLGDGISVITMFDENRQPAAERLFFHFPVHQMAIDATFDHAEYQTRSPVGLSIRTSAEGIPAAARLSASIFRLDTLQQVPRENIVSWLLLRSDLPGLPPDVGRYLGRDDDESRLALDNIMLTSGWRRFRFAETGNGKSSVFHFLPEMEGPVLYARVVNRGSGQPVANVPYLMAVPGRRSGLNTSTSDTNGELRFAARSFAKNDPVILQPRYAADSVYRLDVDHAFSDSVTECLLPPIRLDRGVSPELTQRHVALQIASSFPREKHPEFLSVKGNDSIHFYGVPDRHFHLENYTRYVTMEEVLREFVDDVRIRKDGKQYHFFVRNILFNTFFENEPLILLDGVPVSDPTKIINLDPLKISDIDIVTHRFSRGSSDFEGIVIIHSNSGESGAANLDPGAVILDYAGLQERREFYSPDYSDSGKAASSIPDYRTTLWWSADLRTDKLGLLKRQFFTGDLAGHYALVIQGITPGGSPGYQVKLLSITQKE